MKTIINSAAHARAGERLIAAQQHIRGAFYGLETGWTLDDVDDYLLGAVIAIGYEPSPQLTGLVAAFGLVMVERDREMHPRLSN